MPDQQPHFLISVPTYNRSHLLEKLVESARSQNYTSWDILFMDDGSTDDTQEVVQNCNPPPHKPTTVEWKKTVGLTPPEIKS